MSRFEVKLDDYKDHEIVVRPNSGRFSAVGFDSYETLGDLKKAIDASLKIKYKPVPVLVVDVHYGSFKEAVATCPHKSAYSKDSVWIKEDGKRSTSTNAYADSQENRAILEKIAEHRTQEKQHRMRADDMAKQLSRAEFVPE